MHFDVVCPHETMVHVPTRPGSKHDEHASVHAVSQQRPSAQCCDPQSISILQAWPAPHFLQFEPPQSISLSSPFVTPSEQLAHVAPKQYSPAVQPAIGWLVQVTQAPVASQTPVCPPGHGIPAAIDWLTHVL